MRQVETTIEHRSPRRSCKPRGARLLLVFVAAFAITCLTTPLSSASAEVKFRLEKGFGPDGTEATSFVSVDAVTVDQSEKRVYVLDRKAKALYKFDFAGNPVDFGGTNPDVSGNKLSGLSLSGIAYTRQIAVDSATHTIYLPGKDDALEFGGTVLQAFDADGDPSEFTEGPGAGSNEIPGFHGLEGLAVDGEGNLYASESGDNENPGQLSVYRASGGLLVPAFEVNGAHAAAVDANGTLYVRTNVPGGTGRFIPSEYPLTPETTYSQQGSVSAKSSFSLAVDPAFNRLFAAEEFQNGSVIGGVSVFDQDGALGRNVRRTGRRSRTDRSIWYRRRHRRRSDKNLHCQ